MKIWKVFYFWFVYLFCQLKVSSCPDSFFGTQLQIAEFGVFSPAYYYHLFFAFISYLNYLRCLYYQQQVMFDVFCSNKQCNSVWEFMGWSLCMMFWCILYLCFGIQGFQNMSRPGCTDWMPLSWWSTGFSRISSQRYLIHILWGHCVRWTKAQKQEWTRGSFQKSSLVRTKILKYLQNPSPMSFVLKWKL